MKINYLFNMLDNNEENQNFQIQDNNGNLLTPYKIFNPRGILFCSIKLYFSVSKILLN